MKNNNKIVYSYTLGEQLKKFNPEKKDQTVKIRLEKNGRGGKLVSFIYNIPDNLDPDLICSEIKKKRGTGGSVKDGAIEIQGDNREFIEKYFTEKGIKVKFAGG